MKKKSKLIEGYFDPINYSRNTPLSVAISLNNENFALLLIENFANLNLCNNDNDSPLMIAIRKNCSEDLLTVLLNKNANPNLINNVGEIALTIAIKKENINAFNLLIK